MVPTRFIHKKRLLYHEFPGLRILDLFMCRLMKRRRRKKQRTVLYIIHDCVTSLPLVLSLMIFELAYLLNYLYLTVWRT